MAIVFSCPKCKARITLDDAAAGHHGTCPHCNGAIKIPRIVLNAEQTIGLVSYWLITACVMSWLLISREFMHAALSPLYVAAAIGVLVAALAIFPYLIPPTNCDYCGCALKRSWYYWVDDGGARLTACPNCNQRLERKASRRAIP